MIIVARYCIAASESIMEALYIIKYDVYYATIILYIISYIYYLKIYITHILYDHDPERGGGRMVPPNTSSFHIHMAQLEMK